MSSNLNQFKQAAEVGDQDLSLFGGDAVISVLYDPTEASATVAPGEGVTLTDLGADDQVGAPIVKKRAAETTTIFGVRLRNTKNATTAGGETMEVAVFGAVVWMKASGAIARGDKLSLVQATPGSVQAVGTKAYFGVALDKASSGALLRVWIKADAVTAGS